jgi:hypothetical protein
MISWSEWEFVIICHQFIERTEMAAAVNKLTPSVSRIIPGDWGKVESGW